MGRKGKREKSKPKSKIFSGAERSNAFRAINPKIIGVTRKNGLNKVDGWIGSDLNQVLEWPIQKAHQLEGVIAHNIEQLVGDGG